MMSETSLRVPEMTCEHCEAVIKRALGPLSGVTSVTIDLDTKLVRVEHEGDQPTVEQLRSAVEAQGYEVTGWAAP
jgi:copper chaperone